jgi:hypothetical protein
VEVEVSAALVQVEGGTAVQVETAEVEVETEVAEVAVTDERKREEKLLLRRQHIQRIALRHARGNSLLERSLWRIAKWSPFGGCAHLQMAGTSTS